MKTIQHRFPYCALLAGILFTLLGQASENGRCKAKFIAYIGSYTDGSSKGIYAYEFDAHTGEAKPLGLAAESTNPSFLAVHPSQEFLYAVEEVGNYDGVNSGAIRAFAIDGSTGKLTPLNEVASRGADPCYLAVDKPGKYVLAANYTGGSVAVFPVLEDGRLGESSAFVQHKGSGANPERQKGPHAHSINLSADNRFAVATDLGADRLIIYRFDDRKGSLSPNDSRFLKVDPGAGPRHFTFHPNGRIAYLVNEMQSTVIVFAYDAAAGTLRELQKISTLPSNFAGRNDVAEVQVHPSGKFLYVSNRGHDSIAVFSIDPRKGTLEAIKYVPTRGKEPRHFGIDPTGSYLLAANQKSGTIVIFRIDANTGHLTPTGRVLETPSPVYVKFVTIQ
jgi:6-phosphogluconolactonase